MLPPINLGHSDFVSLRRRGELYVDRSAFIGAVLGNPNRVLLFPRPRRFGKTLAMSMLRAWLERGPDNAGLFDDLKVWTDPVAQAHRQRYAVIALSLKDAKAATWTEARRTLNLLVQQELLRWRDGVAPLFSTGSLENRKVTAQGPARPEMVSTVMR